MNLRSLPILAILALAPIALAAQQTTLVSPSPTLYAATSAPITFSSSRSSYGYDYGYGSQYGSAATKTNSSSAIPFSGLAVAVKVGVAGIGFDVATPLIHQWLNLRSGASFISYTPSTITEDNLNINGTIKFQNAATMVDFFPFHGRFRISGGMTMYNNTGLTASMNVPSKQSFTLGGQTYYSDPTNVSPLTGNGIFTFGGKTSPRLTIGTGNMLPKKGRLTFQSEIGVEFISQPTVAFNFSGTACKTLVGSVYSNCGPVLQSDVQDEQTKLQNDLTDLRYFPILSIGLSYRIH
jgi:hypothetical protein